MELDATLNALGTAAPGEPALVAQARAQVLEFSKLLKENLERRDHFNSKLKGMQGQSKSRTEQWLKQWDELFKDFNIWQVEWEKRWEALPSMVEIAVIAQQNSSQATTSARPGISPTEAQHIKDAAIHLATFTAALQVRRAQGVYTDERQRVEEESGIWPMPPLN